MMLQNGVATTDGGAGTEELLTADERVRARKKVIATWDLVLAIGGPRDCVPLPFPSFVITLYAGTCQMDHPHLEPRLFVVSATDARVTDEFERAAAKGRRPTMLPLQPPETHAQTHTGTEPGSDAAPTWYFDAGAYRACIAEDLALLLAAFESEVTAVNAANAHVAAHTGAHARDRQGYLKLPAMGLSHNVALADGTPVGHLMFAPFLAGLRDVLCSRPTWPFLAAIELPDYTGSGDFTPRFTQGSVPVRLVTGRRGRRDVLAFTDEEAATYICGVVSPGSAFALPGNGPTAASLESVIAANTTQRRGAWYTYNPALLSPACHVPVHTGFHGQVRWWPPTAWRRKTGRAAHANK